MQDCSNSIANALELLQSCTKPSKYTIVNSLAHLPGVNELIFPHCPARFDWLLQPTFQKASITEMEILQAVTIAEAQHAFFYFRQPDHVEDLFRDLPPEERQEKLKPFLSESPHHKAKMDKMKNKLVKQGGLQIRYYRTPCELADRVLEDWTGVINQLYPPLENIVQDICKCVIIGISCHIQSKSMT